MWGASFLTSWIDKDRWHQWLDETGYRFDIAQFYYEDGDQVRFKVVEVAIWLAEQPEAMQSFLSRFEPDGDDISLAQAELLKAHEYTTQQVLQRWLAAEAHAPTFLEDDEITDLPAHVSIRGRKTDGHG
jgi:hypothetical protein